MLVWLWQDLCTAVFHPPTCAEGECSLSFHCILLEHQAEQLDADRRLTLLKPFPIFNVNYYFLFVHRHEQAGQKNKFACVPGKTVRDKVSCQLG